MVCPVRFVVVRLCPFERSSEAERARAANSNAPARPNLTELSGAEQKLLPITDEQKTALFERKKRTPLTAVGSSCTFGACCGSGQARATRSEPAVAPGQARATLIAHSVAPEQARAAHFEHSDAPGQARAALIEPFAAPGQARAAIFEHSAAQGQARAVISSQLRLRGRLERPFRGSCGPRAGFDDSCGVSSRAEPS